MVAAVVPNRAPQRVRMPSTRPRTAKVQFLIGIAVQNFLIGLAVKIVRVERNSASIYRFTGTAIEIPRYEMTLGMSWRW